MREHDAPYQETLEDATTRTHGALHHVHVPMLVAADVVDHDERRTRSHSPNGGSACVPSPIAPGGLAGAGVEVGR